MMCLPQQQKIIQQQQELKPRSNENIMKKHESYKLIRIFLCN